MKVFKIVGWVVFGLVAAAALGLALGFPVMWLWNWRAPALFHLPAITFWQAVGLMILCHLLFKGHGPGFHDRNHGDRAPWNRFAKRVKSAMDQEDPRSSSPVAG